MWAQAWLGKMWFLILAVAVLIVAYAITTYRDKKRGVKADSESSVSEEEHMLNGIAGQIPGEDKVPDENKNKVEQFYSASNPQAKRGRYLAEREKEQVRDVVEEKLQQKEKKLDD